MHGHHFERVLAQFEPSARRSYVIHFETDLTVVARALLARVLWLLGFPNQAMHAAAIAVNDARTTDHALTLCVALVVSACPVALLVGDLDAAERYADMLLDHSGRRGLTAWYPVGRIYKALLAVKRGDADQGQLTSLHASFDEFRSEYVIRNATFLDVKAEVLAYEGNVGGALAMISETIEELERVEELWLVPELRRRKGVLLFPQDEPGAKEMAEQCLRQALDQAHRQGALSWELRAATGFARLLCDQGHLADARALLQPVYGRFTEGFETADLKAAKALLDAF